MNEKKLTQSSTDGENFVHVFPELAGAQVEKNQILGRVSLPGGRRAPCRCIWGNWSPSLNRLTANRIVSAHTSPSAATIRHTWGTGSKSSGGGMPGKLCYLAGRCTTSMDVIG